MRCTANGLTGSLAIGIRGRNNIRLHYLSKSADRDTLAVWNARCSSQDRSGDSAAVSSQVVPVDATQRGDSTLEQQCKSSMFNLRVPLESGHDVFLMNTMTDAQLVVSSDVAALLDRFDGSNEPGVATLSGEERDAVALLEENGFLVSDRAAERRSLEQFFQVSKSQHRRTARHGADHSAVQLRLRLLLPGRSRRLQQVRGEDVARDGPSGRRLDRAGTGSRPARQAHPDVLRRRAAAESAGRCMRSPSGWPPRPERAA